MGNTRNASVRLRDENHKTSIFSPVYLGDGPMRAEAVFYELISENKRECIFMLNYNRTLFLSNRNKKSQLKRGY